MDSVNKVANIVKWYSPKNTRSVAIVGFFSDVSTFCSQNLSGMDHQLYAAQMYHIFYCLKSKIYIKMCFESCLPVKCIIFSTYKFQHVVANFPLWNGCNDSDFEFLNTVNYCSQLIRKNTLNS